MSLEQTACDDLKAFERRLTEVVSCLQPATLRWRILLAVVSVCTAVAAWHWLTDPMTPVVSLTQSLCNHPFFTFTSTLLVLLFLLGVHRKVIAPSIVTARTRSVLNDFNMSCDETGKLILKPRPANNSRGCIEFHFKNMVTDTSMETKLSALDRSRPSYLPTV